MIEYDFVLVEKCWELVYMIIEKGGIEIDEELRKKIDEKILEICKKIY